MYKLVVAALLVAAVSAGYIPAHAPEPVRPAPVASSRTNVFNYEVSVAPQYEVVHAPAPAPVHHAPAPVLVAAPAPVHHAPAPVLVAAPAPVHHAPAPVLVAAPAPVHHAPTPAPHTVYYAVPAPVHGHGPAPGPYGLP